MVDHLLALIDPLAARLVDELAAIAARRLHVLDPLLASEGLLFGIDLLAIRTRAGAAIDLLALDIRRPRRGGLLARLLALFAGLASLFAGLVAVVVVRGSKRRSRRGARQENGDQELTHDSDLSSSLRLQMRFFC